MSGWWLGEPASELSQGDVLEAVPFSDVYIPEIFLEKRSLSRADEQLLAEASSETPPKGGRIVWVRRDACPTANESGCLAAVWAQPGIVLSHDCEIDKPGRRLRIHVAPVHLASRLDGNAREAIFAQRRPALMPLPEVPQLGDCYADLRQGMPILHGRLKDLNRMASMTEAARGRLWAQLIAFYSRLEDN